MNNICHQGKVLAIHKDKIKVRIQQNSACTGCHAKSACTLSETKEKVIEVVNIYPNVQVGDRVDVEISFSLGMKAVGYAFVIPLILVFSIIVLLLSFQTDEFVAALSALVFLAVYYLVLYFYRERLDKKFVFTLKL